MADDECPDMIGSLNCLIWFAQLLKNRSGCMADDECPDMSFRAVRHKCAPVATRGLNGSQSLQPPITLAGSRGPGATWNGPPLRFGFLPRRIPCPVRSARLVAPPAFVGSADARLAEALTSADLGAARRAVAWGSTRGEVRHAPRGARGGAEGLRACEAGGRRGLGRDSPRHGLPPDNPRDNPRDTREIAAWLGAGFSPARSPAR